MSAYEPKRTSVVCLERRFRDRFGFPKTQRMLMEGTRRAFSTWLSFAFAQQTQAPKRVGLMANLPLPPVLRFRERLQKLSWVEGKNLLVEYRYGEGRNDHFPKFAAELVSMPVDVLVVWGTPAAFAAKRATKTIPVLIGVAGDVENTGLVSNLARPEANLTGFVSFNVDLENKHLEVLK